MRAFHLLCVRAEACGPGGEAAGGGWGWWGAGRAVRRWGGGDLQLPDLPGAHRDGGRGQGGGRGGRGRGWRGGWGGWGWGWGRAWPPLASSPPPPPPPPPRPRPAPSATTGLFPGELDIALVGSYGTKVEAVVRRVKWLLAEHGPADGRALLFSAWVGVLDVLSHALAANGVRAAQPRGTKALGDAIAAFRRGDPARRDPAVLLMPVQAGANGLNLTEAAHVLLVEPQADPAVEAQAAGRVHRIGQTRPTTVHRFVVEGTVEEGVDRLARARRAALAAGGGGGGETGGGEEATAAALAAAGAPTSRAHHGEPALSVADVVRLLQHGGGRRVGGEEGRE